MKVPPEQRKAGFELWTKWMQKAAGAIVDGGAPLAAPFTVKPPGRQSKSSGIHPDASEPRLEMIRNVLTLGAVLAWIFGAMLLLAPGPFFAPMGIAMDEKVATIAQNQGAALIAIGLINFLCRG